ncbi:MAG: nucleotidyltransferase domain-containing protein [Candidatus Schekmanbacteria bacterium]|nr:nucleotidyltransferase domain-containing protein [Candidatus Schekmanbacteria bacterium]
MKELTKNRAGLLRLFYTNPEREFYIQEIGRILGKKPGVFQRMLNNMEKEKIISSEYRANARYFRANKTYPLYKELKSIVFKTVGITGSIKEVLDKIGNIKLSFIYGSFAKEKETILSDIDLVIIGKPDEDKLIKQFDKLEDTLRREINYKLFSPAEFRKNVEKEEPFLIEIIREKKIMITGTEDELRKILEVKPH